MANRPIWEPQGGSYKVRLKFDKGLTGTNKNGNEYCVYCVDISGVEYSWFAPPSARPVLDSGSKGSVFDVIVIAQDNKHLYDVKPEGAGEQKPVETPVEQAPMNKAPASSPPKQEQPKKTNTEKIIVMQNQTLPAIKIAKMFKKGNVGLDKFLESVYQIRQKLTDNIFGEEILPF